MGTGWQSRLQILRRDAERKILSPLKLHGWTAFIKQEVEKGDYIVIEATRNSHNHAIALLYTRSTENIIYIQLDAKVEHIFINTSASELKSVTYGGTITVESVGGFHDLLLKWNKDSADGRFAPVQGGNEHDDAVKESDYQRIQSENPLKSIWIHLRQFESVTLSKKLITKRARTNSIDLPSDIVTSKGEGLAYAIRNASDYYLAAEGRSMSQRVLNLYYGTLAFAFAEVLSAPKGPETLAEIEDSTKQGHGLYTVEGDDDGLSDLVIALNRNGFYPTYMAALGHTVAEIPQKKSKKFKDLKSIDHSFWCTFEGLISRIPDIGDLYINIFNSNPGWIVPMFDSEANHLGGFGSSKKASRSYVKFIDRSKRWTKDDILRLKAPFSEICETGTKIEGRFFRAAIDHVGHDNLWGVLTVHRSPFLDSSLIVPAFGMVDEYRAICLAILYGLSIVVRYRPSLWRRIQEGDLDHLRVLIEAYLDVIERVLPEQFLEHISGQKVIAKQPGGLF